MLNHLFILNKQCLIYFISLLFLFIYCDDNCWIKFDANEHFDVMDEIDDRYAEVRENFQEAVGGKKFDKDMLVVMIKTRGIAERALHKAQGYENMIPAGINLGGHCMMRIPKSLVFFHRMKLRNNTRFRIVDLKNNLTNLELKAYLDLNDLHLFGSYDISHTVNDNSLLLYYPSFGEVEFLLKNVSYKIEGRYRLLHNRLNIELVTSEILMDDILMVYQNETSKRAISLAYKNIEPFTDRLKVDLDKWIKDYFNDYLMYFVIAEDSEFEKYNQEKTTALNNYADKVIKIIKKRLNDMKAHAVQLPKFTIKTENGAEIQLRNGALRGLDSIYRRSIATGTKANNIRKVDTVVGFSDLKLIYRYDTIPQTGSPPVTGVLTLIADDLTAHLGLALIKDPESADLSFKFLEQTKPESLTVEGSANRMISNFKYVLERHVIGIMMNSLMHNINMLGTLDRCVPIFAPFKEPVDAGTDIDYSLELKNKLKANEKSNDTLSEHDHTQVNIEHPETEDIHKQDNQQQFQDEPSVNPPHPEVVESVVSQQKSQEGPIISVGEAQFIEKEESHQQENQQPSQDGTVTYVGEAQFKETEGSHGQKDQQQSQERDVVKETADNTLNSGDSDNKASTHLILVGHEDKNSIDKSKKFKYLRQNPKFKIKKQRMKAAQHNIKH